MKLEQHIFLMILQQFIDLPLPVFAWSKADRNAERITNLQIPFFTLLDFVYFQYLDGIFILESSINQTGLQQLFIQSGLKSVWFLFSNAENLCWDNLR